MTQRQFKRRQVLVGLGAVGAISAGAGAGLLGSRRPFTRYTYAQTDEDTSDAILRVAWYETYNGRFQETQGGGSDPGANETLDPITEPLYVDEATGPIVSLSNVLPGDEGTLVVGLAANEADTKVWFRPTITATSENGYYEPEISEGDATGGADEGELQDALVVQLWEDTGVLGSGIGGCDGRFLGDPELTSGETPLATVAGDFADGVELLACLRDGSNYCLGLQWALPATTDNVVQTDSVDFTLEFVAVPCSDTCNPFTGDCGGEE